MNKFIQIALVVILVTMLFQTAAGPLTSPGRLGASAVQNIAFTTDSSGQSHQQVICLGTGIVICFHPNVGWNS